MRALLLVSVCSVLLACGDAPKPAARAPAPRRAAVVQIDMAHNRFAPRRVSVRVGQAARWINRDAVAHTVASQTLRLSSEAVGPGETFTYRPRRAGTFKYFCTIHFGQTGRLIVR